MLHYVEKFPHGRTLTQKLLLEAEKLLAHVLT